MAVVGPLSVFIFIFIYDFFFFFAEVSLSVIGSVSLFFCSVRGALLESHTKAAAWSQAQCVQRGCSLSHLDQNCSNACWEVNRKQGQLHNGTCPLLFPSINTCHTFIFSCLHQKLHYTSVLSPLQTETICRLI